MSSRAVLPAILLIVLVAGVASSPALFAKIVFCKQWFISSHLRGVLCFTMMFSVAMASMLPYTPFCIATGYVWGFTDGMLVQLLAIFTSSGFIYGLGRGLKLVSPTTAASSWEWNREWTNLVPEIDRNWRHAAKLNFLLCFVPMPYGVHVYIFALSQHPFLVFTTVFEIGMIGHMILNLKIGSLLASHDDTNVHILKTWGVVVSICVMLFATLVGGCLAQRQLNSEGRLQPEDELALVCVDCTGGDSPSTNERVELLDPIANTPPGDCLVEDTTLV